MTFDARETSRTLGEPITLYKFSVGDTLYGYTDAEQAKIVGAVEYEPIPIDRGAVNTSGTLDKSALTVMLPAETAVAELFRVYPPTDPVSLVIYQGHEGDGEFLAIWTGRVLSCSREDRLAEFTCEPVSTSMRRPGLRRHYQYGCPLALYGPQCRANRDAATITAVVSTINGTVLTFPTDWEGSYNRQRFLGGLVEWVTPEGRTELRTIMKVTVNTIRMGGVPIGMSAGDTVKVILGCRHTMVDCQDLHDNIHNYGGQPWIPVRSPLGTVNNYY